MSSLQATTSSNSVPTLTPFDAKDFGLWKLRNVGILIGAGLYEVVETPVAQRLLEEERMRNMAAAAAGTEDGSDSSSASKKKKMVVDEEHAIILRKSKRAYGALVASLKSEQLRLVQHLPAGDAHALWNVLLETYERKSLATRVQLMEKLFSLQMNSGERVALYVARLTEIDRKLKEQEEPVSPSMLLFVLLRGVGENFSTVVTFLKMKEKLTFDEAVESLKNEEERMEMDYGSHMKNMEESAHYVGAPKGKYKVDSKRSRGLSCFTCGQSGHIKWNCPKNAGKKKCTRCHRVGHDLGQCRAVTMEQEELAAHAMRENDDRDSDSEDEWNC